MSAGPNQKELHLFSDRHFRNVHPKEKITDEMASMSSLETKNSTMKCTIDNCDIPFVKRYVPVPWCFFTEFNVHLVLFPLLDLN